MLNFYFANLRKVYRTKNPVRWINPLVHKIIFSLSFSLDLHFALLELVKAITIRFIIQTGRIGNIKEKGTFGCPFSILSPSVKQSDSIKSCSPIKTRFHRINPPFTDFYCSDSKQTLILNLVYYTLLTYFIMKHRHAIFRSRLGLALCFMLQAVLSYRKVPY